MNNLPIQSVETAVNARKDFCTSLPSALSKVRKVLRNYAEFKGTTYSKLLVMDLCHDVDRYRINPSLQKFLESFFQKKDQLYQAKSRLHQILRSIWGESVDSSGENGFFEEAIVPPFLKPVLPVLGREKGWSKGKTMYDLRLSDVSQKVLTAILEIASEHDVKDMDSLFVSFRPHIYTRIREITEAGKRVSATGSFEKVWQRLGYKSLPKFKGGYKPVPLKDFPPILRDQVNTLIEKGPFGLESEPHLRSRAAQRGIEVKRLELSTIGLYVTRISHALGRMKIKNYKNTDIRTLLKIEVEKKKDESGYEYLHLFNPYVEQFREIERFRETDRRDKGFDTKQFAVFLSAVKAVAVFNGIFHLHENFGKAYSVILDRRTTNLRKEAKKSVFDREWIDSEIARLGKKFHAIIKAKSFKFSPGASNHDPGVKNMRICLFYVYLVTLRYIGCRQQCLRNCEIDKNIFFERDGQIRFRWLRNQVKNDREIISLLDPVEDHDFLGILITTLNMYYRHIYPFISKSAGKEIEGQFFVCISYGRFCRLDPESPSNFYRLFKDEALSYIEFEGRLDLVPTGLHPHFFRGMCSDWLYYDIGLSEDNAARYIGDSVQTFRINYLDRSLAFNSRDALSQARENLKARRKDMGKTVEVSSVSEMERLYQRELAERNERVQQLLRSREEAECRIDFLQESLHQTRQEVKDLQACFDPNI